MSMLGARWFRQAVWVTQGHVRSNRKRSSALRCRRALETQLAALALVGAKDLAVFRSGSELLLASITHLPC
jgi:hypothetical protein